MLSTQVHPSAPGSLLSGKNAAGAGAGAGLQSVAHGISKDMRLIEATLPFSRKLLQAGAVAYRMGDALQKLYWINAGVFKTVNLAADGREQVVSLHFKGDWLGFDGIAKGQHGCSVVAMDVSELWCIRYADLMQACLKDMALLALVHRAMSQQICASQDALLSMCTLPADARVAEFLRRWAMSLAIRGLRNDHLMLRMSRAEIGNHLGMTLETVSRALSRLAREGLISFAAPGRRELQIQDVDALAAFVGQHLNSQSAAPALH